MELSATGCLRGERADMVGASASHQRCCALALRCCSLGPIHERDIAAVTVRALTEDGHAGKKYTLTGGELLTQVEQLQTISQTIGRNLRYEELTPDVAREQMSAFLPPFIIDGFSICGLEW